MDWIKITNPDKVRLEIPKDELFICLWKGAIGLACFDTDENKIFISLDPSTFFGGNSLLREREGKITHWFPLSRPEGY